jgi:YbbR domain-containing protein
MSTIRFIQQFGLKLMSLVLAGFLWLIVAGGETVERGLQVPLELQQFPPGLELQGEAPASVDVRVRGPSGTISRITQGDAAAVLNLSGATAGRRLFQVTPGLVRVPFGVEVVQIVPDTIAMVFEKSDTKIVPVVPVVEGDPFEGYVVGKVVTDPETVEISGPASSVARVTEAMTETISVDGARQGLTQSVTIGFADQAVRLKTPGRATVLVEVLPGARERSVPDRTVQWRNLSADLTAKIVPSVVDVVLRSNRAGLAAIDADAVTPLVDLTGLGVGDHTLTVQVDTSTSSVSVVGSPNPHAVRVSISRVQR